MRMVLDNPDRSWESESLSMLFLEVLQNLIHCLGNDGILDNFDLKRR